MTEPTGLILAGGLSRRMGGGDKALAVLAGRPLLAHVVDRLRPQVGRLVLNANGDPARFAAFGLPVLADGVAGHAGPLAGILAGLEAVEADVLAVVPCDTPLFPDDLVVRLAAALTQSGADVAVAASAERAHPVFGLWCRRTAPALRRLLVEEGERRLLAAAERLGAVTVTWPGEPFHNANTPEDLGRLESLDRHPADDKLRP